MADYNPVMNEWDARECNIIVDGITMFGFQDGDMVGYEFNNANAGQVIDPQGNGSRYIINDHSGKITINLSQTSPCNEKLLDLINKNKEVVISVTTSNESVSGQRCTFEKDPGGSFGKTIGNIAYVADVIDLKHTRAA